MSVGFFFAAAVDFSGSESDPSTWVASVFGGRGRVAPGATFQACISPSTLPGNQFQIVSNPRGFVLVGFARLSNQGGPVSESLNVRDTDLERVLNAYERWGTDVGTHLAGDYVFVVWDPRLRAVIACRDHIGSQPIYHWSHGDRHLLASDPRLVLNHDFVPRRLNRNKLGAVGLEGSHLREETLHEGIFALSAGSVTVIGHHSVAHKRYWEPDYIPCAAPLTEKKAAERLRELLFAAVGDQLQGDHRLGCLLSGGIDSSTIAGVASVILARSNKELTLLTAVLPDSHDGRLKDERVFAAEFANAPNLVLRYVAPREGEGPFDCLENLSAFEKTFKRSTRQYLNNALEAEASACSIDRVLNGIGGELGVTFHGEGQYLHLLTHLRWIEFFREVHAFRTRTGSSVIRPLAAHLREVLRPNYQKHPSLLLTKEFRDKFVISSGWRFRIPDGRSIQLHRQRFWAGRHVSAHPAMPSGCIPYSYPLLDRRLLEFCVALPGELKIRHGWTRYLLRQALTGILPEKIRVRTTKAPYSPDYFIRYNRGLPAARKFIAEIGPRDPVRTIVDVNRLQSLLLPVDPVKGGNFAARAIPNSIYLICFLRQFAEFRP